MHSVSHQTSMRWSFRVSLGPPEIDPFAMEIDDHYYYTGTWLQWYYEIGALEHLLEFSAMGMGLAGDKNGDGMLEFEELLEYTHNMASLSASDQQIVHGLKILLRKYWLLAENRGYLLEEDLRARLSTLLFRLISNVLIRPSLGAAELREFARNLLYTGVLRKKEIASLRERVIDRMVRKRIDPNVVYTIFEVQ